MMYVLCTVLILHIETGIRLEEYMLRLYPSFNYATQVVFLFRGGVYAVSHKETLKHGSFATCNDLTVSSAIIKSGQCPFNHTPFELIIEKFYQFRLPLTVNVPCRSDYPHGIYHLYLTWQLYAKIVFFIRLAVFQRTYQPMHLCKGQIILAVAVQQHTTTQRMPAIKHILPLLMRKTLWIYALRHSTCIGQRITQNKVFRHIWTENYRFFLGKYMLRVAMAEELTTTDGKPEINIRHKRYFFLYCDIIISVTFRLYFSVSFASIGPTSSSTFLVCSWLRLKARDTASI
nr:MAG TPA: hypothetical protein [Caudoviricetes sp.]